MGYQFKPTAWQNPSFRRAVNEINWPLPVPDVDGNENENEIYTTSRRIAAVFTFESKPGAKGRKESVDMGRMTESPWFINYGKKGSAVLPCAHIG